jgi:ABC-type tungstate transport system substrate-binding protein
MNLPSFLWLWKIAAWSMGLAVVAYLILGVTGTWIFRQRVKAQPRPKWLRPLHYGLGMTLVGLVLLLLSIGIVGTLGHFGSLGHSAHLGAGLSVVVLVLISAFSATQISPKKPWARSLHRGINLILLFGLIWVSLTGWDVVQKYLP